MIIPRTFINIGVWNIQGLFPKVNNVKVCKLEDPEILKRIADFDVFCFQEIQCSDKELKFNVPGFRKFPFTRKVSSNNRFYGGSLLLIKSNIKEGVKIIENNNPEKVWIKFEKKFFNLTKDLYQCFSYAPPLNSPYTQSLDYDVLETLENDISKYKNDGNIIVGGDFNGKTDRELDFVLDSNDEHSPVMDIPSYVGDIPLKRQNYDKHSVDKQGENLLALCKNCSMRILNGRTKGDRFGKFTRYPMSMRESPSTLDYVLADTESMKEVNYFLVLSNLGLSDHECLSFSVKSIGFTPATEASVPLSKMKPFCKPDIAKFLRRLNSPVGKLKADEFMEKHSTEGDVDDMSQDLIDLVKWASESDNQNKRKKKKSKKDKNPWFDDECRKMKGCLNRAVKRFRNDPFNRRCQDVFL